MRFGSNKVSKLKLDEYDVSAHATVFTVGICLPDLLMVMGAFEPFMNRISSNRERLL
jgi:hypothetical protein